MRRLSKYQGDVRPKHDSYSKRVVDVPLLLAYAFSFGSCCRCALLWLFSHLSAVHFHAHWRGISSVTDSFPPYDALWNINLFHYRIGLAHYSRDWPTQDVERDS